VGVMGLDERDIIVGDLDKTGRVSFDSNGTNIIDMHSAAYKE
jgi:hypothetical protein